MNKLEHDLLLRFGLLNKVQKFYIIAQLDKLLDSEIAETDFIWKQTNKKNEIKQ